MERLHQKVSALRTALEEQANQLGRRVAAKARVDAETARARRLIAQIDTIVTPLLRDPGSLAQWKSLVHFTTETVPVVPEPGKVPTTGASPKEGATV